MIISHVAVIPKQIVAVLEQLKEEKKNSATYEKETTYEQVILPSDVSHKNKKKIKEEVSFMNVGKCVMRHTRTHTRIYF